MSSLRIDKTKRLQMLLQGKIQAFVEFHFNRRGKKSKLAHGLVKMTTGQLESFGVLEKWSEIKSYLFPNSVTNQGEEEKDDWAWDDEETTKTKDSKKKDDLKKQSDSWSQNCVMTHSPMGDMLVIAGNSRAVFFTSEWDVKSARMKFQISFQGELAQEEGEKITSAICIPLVSKKKTSPGAPDWTCVFIGFSTGQVRMYTENGSNLTLRACRNHLARIQANATENVMDPPPLTYKKWQYENEQPANDCESIGLHTPVTFDHLFNGSILGGFQAKCKSVPLTSFIFVSTGKKPYLAFNYAQEGQAIPVLTEIAYAMASKLKSSLISAASGWLGFGGGASKAPPPKEKPQIEPATSMSSRFGLVDSRRIGQTVSVSPCRKLSAVTDSLGRVLLIDNNLGIAVRMWKGYREAQVGWLQVTEEVSSRSRREIQGRKALFLVIYAPRRGHLEVYTMQQGPKVATFNVSKNGRLISTTFGMMGLNNIPIKGGNIPSVQCLFIDQDANLFTLCIPFHLVLCDKTASKLKDIHLLKTMQKILKENPEVTCEELVEILTQVRTQAMINQAFKLLSQKCKSVQILKEILDTYMKRYCDEDEKDLSVVFRLQSLTDLYTFLIEAAEKPPGYVEPVEDNVDQETQDLTILRCLHATGKEMRALQDMAEINCARKSKLVKFADEDGIISLNDFLAAISIEFDANKIKATSDTHVKLNHKSDLLQSLGSLVFSGVLNNQSEIGEWKTRLHDAGLIPMEVMQLALKHWSETALLSSSYVISMKQLYQVLTALSELDPSSVSNEFSRVNKWWEEVRKEITKSYKIFHVYSFAIVCRGVAIDLHNNAEIAARERGDSKKASTEETSTDAGAGPSHRTDLKAQEDDSGDDMEGWENISLDNVKWNFLLKQIEDLSILSTILFQRPKLHQPALPLLNNEIQELSVLNLLDKGKGCIAELVGKWLTTIGIDPFLIQNNEVAPKNQLPSSPELKKKSRKKNENDEVVEGVKPPEPAEADTAADALEADNAVDFVQSLLHKLTENFSVSLSSSIILANYCWEYCLQWHKDTNDVQYLDAAVRCVFAIPSPHIKQGMMSMMWSTFLVKKFAVSASVGKLAKDKLVEKPSSFVCWETEEGFLRNCVAFMDHFMEVNVMCDGSKPPRNFSATKSHWSNDMASASLTDLAVAQNPTNYEMLLLHYQLTLVAHFLHKFRIKKSSMKSTALFDTKSRMMFFLDLGAQAPFSNVEVDLGLKVLREEFLCLVISNAIHEIPEELQDDNGSVFSEDNSQYKQIVPALEGVQECENWVRKCCDLGRIWNIDLDCLRINQVCEFYSSGLDLLGLELINSVSARDILGSKLLVIVGMRINFVIDSNPDNVTEIVSSLSTNLSSWLKSLNYSKLRCLRFSKQSITELTQQLIQLIPESSYDYKLAEELLHSGNFL
ncbi:unnamed protein product [Allacma fusca]|uniref:Rab3 GTPase-activating protein non-catalytic subunit n=1 Tax=Allacma fusca TaxID=39272 RepID=A0A8J2PLL1_9HEXA|nr:unnamed protein product [Allacma fusca]